tara:strand:- start:2018 stop:2419 length:402 start_codon:yes stop_codon:yes gene_type:complete
MDLPKVNILTAGTMAIAIISATGGSIWYASSQASVIQGLQSEVEKLTIINNQADKTNLIRDVQQNQENIEELIDILAEVYEDMEDADNELWTDIDTLHEESASMAQHMMHIVKLQARIAVLEKTVEFSRKDGM